MKRRKMFLSVLLTIMILQCILPGKAFAADQIINTVSLHCGIKELHLSPALTEFDVRMRLYKRCGTYTDGAYFDTANLSLFYWNEIYNQIYGIEDGSKQIDENRQYFIAYSLQCEVGYDWSEEVKTAVADFVPITGFPSFNAYVNGKIRKDAYIKYFPGHNRLWVVIPVANDISDGSASLAKTAFTYDGTVKKPGIKSVSLSDGTALTSKNYTVSWLDAGGTKVAPKSAGKYQAVIKGKGIYTGSIKRSFTIKKASNPITAKGKTVTAKKAALDQKNLTYKPAKTMTIKNAQGKLTYKLLSVTNSKYRKYFSVNTKTGVITVKKGLNRGTYRLKIKVTAAGNTNYNSASKELTATIKVA